MKLPSRLWFNDAAERVSATFVMAFVPTLPTALPWWDSDFSHPSKIGLALGAAAGSLAKALAARGVGDSDTAAFLPAKADTPEPAHEEPAVAQPLEQPVTPAPVGDMTSSTISATKIPPPPS